MNYCMIRRLLQHDERTAPARLKDCFSITTYGIQTKKNPTDAVAQPDSSIVFTG